MRWGLVILFVWIAGGVGAQTVPIGAVPAHDPVMIHADSGWYVYCTGMGISVWRSVDLKDWVREPPVFVKPPEWAVEAIRGFRGQVWAPDISYYNGRYYLFYAVSVFGKNTSCIGLATNGTLNPKDSGYHWVDEGKVVESVPGRDLWNAIDPNLAVDGSGGAWLAFGSFWDGIKLVKLSGDRRRLAEPERWYTIAARVRGRGIADSVAGDAAIEAPFIFHKGDYYYLFVSWDYCCRGAQSNYKMVVGRSERIEGPYVDKTGAPMAVGGGSLVLEGDANWYGVGHNAVVSGDGVDWLVFHGYDSHDRGRAKLRIEKLDWVDGWPVVAGAGQR